jgi:hypothetical protein
VHQEAGGRRRCEVRPPADVARVLKAAYGPQPDVVVQRLHRGLNRTARWLEAGDLCHAGVEAVMLGFPDLTPTAMAKLAEIADLEKRGAPWENEPRLPAGQAGGGLWTTGGGGGGGTAASAKPVPAPPPTPPPQREQPVQTLGDGVYRPGAASSPTRAYSQQSQATLNDGVYYFTEGQAPPWITTALPPEEEPVWRRPGKGPEEEGPSVSIGLFGTEAANIEEYFSGLQKNPSKVADWDPPPEVLDYAAQSDDLSAPEADSLYRYLQNEIKAIDPAYNDKARFPESGFSRLSLAERHRVIDDALFDPAAAEYKVRHDPRKLQIETVKFLRKTVDHYYAEGVKEFNAGDLQPRLSREEAIGNYVDGQTRRDLQSLFNRKGIPYGQGPGIAVNNRDYDSSQPGKRPYRVPDLRIGDPRTGDAPISEARVGSLTIDWTIGTKQPQDPQVRGFIHADSRPKAVVLVMPSQLYPPGARYIPRGAVIKGSD